MKKIKSKPIKSLKPIVMSWLEFQSWQENYRKLEEQMEAEQAAQRLRTLQSLIGVYEEE